MSASDYIEEIMWEAHKKGIASEVFNLVHQMDVDGDSRQSKDDLFMKAFNLITDNKYGNKEKHKRLWME
tara:strand:+ start:62 stop:268 length:207 start_codon:yes stop_codon:yes gene_type:complete